MPADDHGSFEPTYDQRQPADPAPETSGPDTSGPDTSGADASPIRGRRPSGPGYPLLPRWLGMALVAIIGGASIFLAGYTLGARVATTPGTPASMEQQFEPFWDVFDLIKERWYTGSPRPTDRDLVLAAIQGMLSSLNDRWSIYQAPQDFQNSNVSVGGHDEGIGVTVQLLARGNANCSSGKIGTDCELTVVKPLPNSPAIKAGIQAGDVIVAANGASLDGLTLDDATSKIKGPQGTTVKLTIQRGTQTLEISIVRALFDRPEVDTRALAGGKAELIDIAGINDVAAGQLHTALADALAHNTRSLIIDLRGNGGGFVPSAVAMASEFIPDGVIVYQQDVSGQMIATNANSGGLATDPSIKVVVLTDQNTASAAEILAGALQARGRAKLVGDRTFGKGLVQVWLPLPNDMGGFHLTVARWLTPTKVWINDKGLQPDVKVGTEPGVDAVLNAALKELGLPAEPGPSSSPPPSPSAVPSPVPSGS